MANLTSIAAGKPYVVHLTFQGAGRYAIYECTTDSPPTVLKTIQADGDPSDSQHDSYNLTPLEAGKQVMVFVGATLGALAAEGGPVAMKAVFTQLDKPVHSDHAEGTDGGNEEVKLVLRAFFVGQS